MRVSVVSILLAGGTLALGACSATVESRAMTLAERTEQCERLRTSLVPTGRQTGDARADYDCSGHGVGLFDGRERRVDSSSVRVSAASRARAMGN